jgi:hypothetical protein
MKQTRSFAAVFDGRRDCWRRISAYYPIKVSTTGGQVCQLLFSFLSYMVGVYPSFGFLLFSFFFE